MLIVDAQVHIWASHTPERPWPADGFGRVHCAEPLTADALIERMDEAGVGRAIIVPPSWEGERNDLALDAARRYPDRFAVMGRLDHSDPANAARLKDWRQQPGMLGIRVTFAGERFRKGLAEGVFDWFWPAAEKAGIPLMISASEVLPAIAAVAERHPGLRIVIDHLAIRTTARDAEAFAALDRLYPLAKYPNVAAKASALPSFSTEPYPYPAMHPHIRRVVDTFGPSRAFWGTDLTRLECTYRQAVTLFTEELGLSAAEKELVMGKGVCDWLGWSAEGSI
jgi:predicted TIM-barrel fold metal-dependent hydrolase